MPEEDNNNQSSSQSNSNTPPSTPTSPPSTPNSPPSTPTSTNSNPTTNPSTNPSTPSMPSTILPPSIEENEKNIQSVNLSLNQTITEPGIVIVNRQGVNADGSLFVTNTTFDTIDPDDKYAPDIRENLEEVVVAYVDNASVETNNLVNQIKLYASEIQCESFHGKGTIDDYNELFRAAANIANDSKQIQLDVNVEGFTEFGAAADELSNLFNGFITKLQSVSIINDLSFLRSIASALQKIVNLSHVFARFKQTIIATSTVQLPKSAHDTKVALESVMGEVSCAMNYINHFVNPLPTDNLQGAELSNDEKNIINKAVTTIDNWNVLSSQGVSIAMNNNTDIQYIKTANNDIKDKTTALRTATIALRNKLSLFNLH